MYSQGLGPIQYLTSSCVLWVIPESSLPFSKLQEGSLRRAFPSFPSPLSIPKGQFLCFRQSSLSRANDQSISFHMKPLTVFWLHFLPSVHPQSYPVLNFWPLFNFLLKSSDITTCRLVFIYHSHSSLGESDLIIPLRGIKMFINMDLTRVLWWEITSHCPWVFLD